MNYTEIKFVLKNDDVVIEPTKNKIEANINMAIENIDFQKQKEKIKEKLLKEEKTENSNRNGINDTKYRKHR